MAKCGKGCMPECEYFMTGGCISPFNCMYKIADISEQCEQLKAENAELRARLDKAVELKAKVGDTIYMPWVWSGKSGIAVLEVIYICL